MALKRMSRKHERVGVGHEPTDALGMCRDGWPLPGSCITAALCWSVNGVRKEGE